MLLHAVQSTLCKWGLHKWQSVAPQDGVGQNENVTYCVHCGATRVILQPGRRIAVDNVGITVSNQDHESKA